MRTSMYSIAWRNLWRNGRRTALAVLAIAVGQWALLATQGLMRGYGDNIQQAITGPLIGHIQIHDPRYREERALDLVVNDIAAKTAAIKALPDVESVVPRIYAPVLMAPQEEAFMATVVGIDVAGESLPFGLLSGNETKLPPRHVFVGYRLAKRSGIAEGTEIALVGQAADGSLANDLYTVQAVIQGPVDLVNQMGVVMGIEDAQNFLALPDQAHEIMVRMNRLDQVEAVLTTLRTMPILEGLEIVPWRELAPELVMIIDMVGYVGWFILILVLIAALAGIVNTLMMATYERMHEFGMLLALGCRPRRIVGMILIEATLLGLLGVGTGTALGLGFVEVTQKTGIDMASWGGDQVKELAYGGIRLPLDIHPRLEVVDPLMGLVAVVLVAVLAAAWPASVAAKLDPMEAMRA